MFDFNYLLIKTIILPIHNDNIKNIGFVFCVLFLITNEKYNQID